jgi:hypothetical protein
MEPTETLCDTALPPVWPARVTDEGVKLSVEQPEQAAVVLPVIAKVVAAPLRV